MIEDIRPRASFVGSVLSFLLAIAIALLVVELTYAGYGESGPPPLAVYLLLAGGWVASIAGSLVLTLILRAQWLPMLTIGVLAWPVAVATAGLFVFFSSCAGYGPHSCAFS